MAREGYFVRFVESAEAAQKDLVRGYSFAWTRGVYPSYDEAIAAGEEMDLEIVQMTSKEGFERWGFAQFGLCGFGPFETIEEAEEEAEKQSEKGFGIPDDKTSSAIFQGKYAGQDIEMIGDLFTPYEIIKVWKH